MTQLSWVAYYEDGKVIREGEVNYYHLPREGLRCFQLLKGDEPKLTLDLTDGRTLFYRRRDHDALFGPGSNFHFFLVGWRKRVGAEIQQKIHIVDEQGNVRELPSFQGALTWIPEWNKSEVV